MDTCTKEERLNRARRSLDGLSVGDAFGERFFATPSVVERMIEVRALPAPPWHFTDDTVMALSVVDTLEDVGRIDCDRLAGFFGARYRLDPGREVLGRRSPWTPNGPGIDLVISTLRRSHPDACKGRVADQARREARSGGRLDDACGERLRRTSGSSQR